MLLKKQNKIFKKFSIMSDDIMSDTMLPLNCPFTELTKLRFIAATICERFMLFMQLLIIKSNMFLLLFISLINLLVSAHLALELYW